MGQPHQPGPAPAPAAAPNLPPALAGANAAPAPYEAFDVEAAILGHMGIPGHLHDTVRRQATAETELRGTHRVGGTRQRHTAAATQEMEEALAETRHQVDMAQNGNGDFLSLPQRLHVLATIDNASAELQVAAAPARRNWFVRFVAEHPRWAGVLVGAAAVAAGLLFTPGGGVAMVAAYGVAKGAAVGWAGAWGMAHARRANAYTQDALRGQFQTRFDHNNQTIQEANMLMLAGHQMNQAPHQITQRYEDAAHLMGNRVLNQALHTREHTRHDIVRASRRGIIAGGILGGLAPVVVAGVSDLMGNHVNWGWHGGGEGGGAGTGNGAGDGNGGGEGSGEGGDATPPTWTPEQIAAANEHLRDQVAQAITNGNTEQLQGVPGLPDFAQMEANADGLAADYNDDKFYWTNVQSAGDGAGGESLTNGQTRGGILHAMSELKNAGYPVDGIGDLKWDGDHWVTTGDDWRFEAKGGFGVEGGDKPYYFDGGQMGNSELAAYTEAINQDGAHVVTADQYASRVEITPGQVNDFLRAETAQIQDHIVADVNEARADAANVTNAQGTAFLNDAIRAEIADNPAIYAALPTDQVADYFAAQANQLGAAVNAPQWINPEAIRAAVEQTMASVK